MPLNQENNPSLASVTFGFVGYHDKGIQNGIHVWHTPAGDGVGLFFFSIPPDLPKAHSCEELRQFYSAKLAAGGRLVELRLVSVDGQPSIATIIKVPQKPTGMTYVGSITIPFRDFSFVFKGQCQEYSPTGIRESTLLDKLLKAEKVTVKAGAIVGQFEPDGATFDAEFPKHPVSRARRILQDGAHGIRLHPSIKSLPSFVLPSPQWDAIRRSLRPGNTELLHLPVQRRALYAQSSGGAVGTAEHPDAVTEHGQDVLALGIRERDRRGGRIRDEG